VSAIGRVLCIDFDTYSAAVCELSDACDMLLARGFADAVVDCESAMTLSRRRCYSLSL
jgi:hypothetical protein